jgi:hypothetical protein
MKTGAERRELVTLLDEPYIFFLKLGKYSFSKYHFGAPGSEEKILRCRHTIYTGIVFTCS